MISVGRLQIEDLAGVGVGVGAGRRGAGEDPAAGVNALSGERHFDVLGKRAATRDVWPSARGRQVVCAFPVCIEFND